jgi:hypothetical protein
LGIEVISFLGANGGEAMRPSFWVVSVLIWASIQGGQQQTRADLCSIAQTDPYSLGVVRSAFDLTQWGPHAFAFWNSVLFPTHSQKAITQLGDGVSVAILKIVDLKELSKSKPETIKGYLQVIHLAFYSPQMILQEADREPKVTLFLLDYLDEKAPPLADVQQEIASVRKYVRKQTGRSAPTANH